VVLRYGPCTVSSHLELEGQSMISSEVLGKLSVVEDRRTTCSVVLEIIGNRAGDTNFAKSTVLLPLEEEVR